MLRHSTSLLVFVLHVLIGRTLAIVSFTLLLLLLARQWVRFFGSFSLLRLFHRIRIVQIVYLFQLLQHFQLLVSHLSVDFLLFLFNQPFDGIARLIQDNGIAFEIYERTRGLTDSLSEDRVLTGQEVVVFVFVFANHFFEALIGSDRTLLVTASMDRELFNNKHRSVEVLTCGKRTKIRRVDLELMTIDYDHRLWSSHTKFGSKANTDLILTKALSLFDHTDCGHEFDLFGQVFRQLFRYVNLVL